MFWHNFKYSVKTLLANKMLLFWTFIFPLVLGLFFNLAFSDIENNEKLDIIDIAIVDDENFKKNEIFKESFSRLSKKGEEQLFKIKYVSLDWAKKLLDQEKISGYLVFNEEDVNITVKSSGINETVLRYVVDEIKSNIKMVNDLTTDEIEKAYMEGNNSIDYQEIVNGAISLINENEVKINNISNENLSYTMIEYYTLIAMACLYGGIISMFIMNYRLPNMKSVGKRAAVAPLKKGEVVLGSLLASFLVQLIGVLILFLFTIFILKVDYGDKLGLIIILALAGSFAGLSLGVVVATLFKVNESAKTGILIAATMVGSFLSGMMGITMKYIVDKNVPILNIINPANMITDGLYALYYYETLDRYIFNVISLLIFSLLMIVLSYRGLRRQKYDSI